MNKKRVFGVIIIIIGIVALVVALFLFNNKKEETTKDEKTKDEKTQDQVKEKEYVEPTSFIKVYLDCIYDNEKDSCKYYFFDENGDRTIINSNSSNYASFNNHLYYSNPDGFLHEYNVETKTDKNTNIKDPTNVLANYYYLLIYEYDEEDNLIMKIYDRSTFEEIESKSCAYNGEWAKNDLFYENCDGKIVRYNIDTKEEKVIYEKKFDAWDSHLDKDKVLFVIDFNNMFLYDLKTDEEEPFIIKVDDEMYQFKVLAFVNNKVFYRIFDYNNSNSDSLYQYDISTKEIKLLKKDLFENKYDILDKEIYYIEDNMIKEYDLNTVKDNILYKIDKKVVDVRDFPSPSTLEDKKHIYYNIYALHDQILIVKDNQDHSQVKCPDECHGTLKGVCEYYLYNKKNNTFKKLDYKDKYEKEE